LIIFKKNKTYGPDGRRDVKPSRQFGDNVYHRTFSHQDSVAYLEI